MEVPLPAGGFLQLSDLRYSLVAENVFRYKTLGYCKVYSLEEMLSAGLPW